MVHFGYSSLLFSSIGLEVVAEGLWRGACGWRSVAGGRLWLEVCGWDLWLEVWIPGIDKKMELVKQQGTTVLLGFSG